MKTYTTKPFSLIFIFFIGIQSIRGQAPNLRSLSNFVLFTSGGAVANTATSHIGGDIGTNEGAITGYGPHTVVSGSLYTANSVTAQAKLDLDSLSIELTNTMTTNIHADVFGNGETLFPGVYSAGAASITTVTSLNLDAQGDPNAVFIFKFTGAFNTGAGASVKLLNGAQASNVFWLVDGAIAMAASTTMQGTLIANTGAVSIGAGGILVGRMMSTLGAISTYGLRISLTPFPFLNPGEAPNLGTVANFAIFTSVGAVTNTGPSTINGDIGTDDGDISGFEPPAVLNGTEEEENSFTAQASTDLDAIFVLLYFTPPSVTNHGPIFGNSETITPGVYAIPAAGSLAGNLILDGQGNANAVFIFKIGAALTTGAGVNVSLINGASAANVFWLSEGATALAANTRMKGTVIANNGAISMGADGNLEGRMLSTIGAASVYSDTINLPNSLPAFPVRSVSFSANCENKGVLLTWVTATETNNDYFSVERSDEGINWEVIGMQIGNGNAIVQNTYSLMDPLPKTRIIYYRLKQTDFGGDFVYGKTIAVKNCSDPTIKISVYPNPGDGLFTIKFNGYVEQIQTVEIFNTQGRKVYRTLGFQDHFDLTQFPPGIYFMKVEQANKSMQVKFVKN